MKLPTRQQISAGGVVFRWRDDALEIAVIRVGDQRRWQLPKGLIDAGETPERAALREVQEEAGVEGQLLAPIETIEYWYVAKEGGERVRFHKFVHYFLLRYRAGDVSAHDHEVVEARWVPIKRAQAMLAFANDRAVVDKAESMRRIGLEIRSTSVARQKRSPESR